MRAALTVVMFLAASLLGALHEATTVHVRCAAHGELVDGAAAVDSTAPPARDGMAQARSSARNGDDHCLLASAVRTSRIVPVSPAVAAAVVSVNDLAAIPPAPSGAVAASLYRIAPKTSPPA